jgi:hypothetical protein
MRAIEVPFDGVFVHLVDGSPFVSKCVDDVAPELWFGTGAIPKFCHVRQKLGILTNGGIGNLESAVSGSKRDSDLPW